MALRSSFYLVSLFLICFISTAISGTVSTLMSVYLPVAVKDVLGNVSENELARISAYINALFILGWALGGFTWGLISDRLGRKRSLLLSIACYGLFTVLTGWMPHWWGIVLCRTMSGFGVGGLLVISFTYISEVWPSKTRSIYIGILSVSFPIGIFSSGVIDYLVKSWREGFLVGVIPVMLAIAGIKIIRESDEWLEVKHNRPASATTPGGTLFAAYKKDLIQGSVIFGTMLIGLWAIFSWLPTWIQSLITDGDGQKERGLSMMILGMGGLAGGFFSGWLSKAVGLRKSLMICFAACALFSFLLFKTNPSFSSIIYPEIIGLALFFGASQGILSEYIPALFPTLIKASATGFCFNTGRLLTALSVLFIGVFVTVFGSYGNALLIFSSVFLVGLATMIFQKTNR